VCERETEDDSRVTDNGRRQGHIGGAGFPDKIGNPFGKRLGELLVASRGGRSDEVGGDGEVVLGNAGWLLLVSSGIGLVKERWIGTRRLRDIKGVDGGSGDGGGRIVEGSEGDDGLERAGKFVVMDDESHGGNCRGVDSGLGRTGQSVSLVGEPLGAVHDESRAVAPPPGR
jgi:hypothetical protein